MPSRLSTVGSLWLLDEASVRTTPAETEAGDSSADDSELNDVDDERLSCDDDEADSAADSQQLEAAVMKQLGLQS